MWGEMGRGTALLYFKACTTICIQFTNYINTESICPNIYLLKSNSLEGDRDMWNKEDRVRSKSFQE